MGEESKYNDFSITVGDARQNGQWKWQAPWRVATPQKRAITGGTGLGPISETPDEATSKATEQAKMAIDDYRRKREAQDKPISADLLS